MNKTNSLPSESVILVMALQVLNSPGDMNVYKLYKGGSHLLRWPAWKLFTRKTVLFHLYLKGNKLSRQRRNQGIFQAGVLRGKYQVKVVFSKS